MSSTTVWFFDGLNFSFKKVKISGKIKCCGIEDETVVGGIEDETVVANGCRKTKKNKRLWLMTVYLARTMYLHILCSLVPVSSW